MNDVCVVVILALVSSGWTCSPEGYREMHMEDMVKGNGIIAYGQVTKIFPHPIQHEKSAFIAEYEVKCTYKNGPVPSMINITNAGYMNGMCGYKNFTIGMDYIAFLSQHDGVYNQMYDKTMEASSSMAKLLSFCDLHLEYPSDTNNTGKCPTGECKPEGPTTLASVRGENVNQKVHCQRGECKPEGPLYQIQGNSAPMSSNRRTLSMTLGFLLIVVVS